MRPLAGRTEPDYFGHCSVLRLDYNWRSPGYRDTAFTVATRDELEQLHVHLPDVERFTNP